MDVERCPFPFCSNRKVQCWQSMRALTSTLYFSIQSNFCLEMLSLCQIAFRVEAAIKAYNVVQNFTDKKDWVKGLNGELVSAHLCRVLTQHLDQFFFQIVSCHSQYLGFLQRDWGWKSCPSDTPHFDSTFDSAKLKWGSWQGHHDSPRQEPAYFLRPQCQLH